MRARCTRAWSALQGYREYDIILGNAGGVRYSVAGATPRYRGPLGTPLRFTVTDRRVRASG